MICCVAGMHRSGTSLVAHWLAQSGLPLAVGGAIGPDISNPEGYYEDLDFVRLHAGHIKRQHRWSHGWMYAPRQFQCFAPAERVRALELAGVRSGGYPNWGWKDPRTMIFLTEWKAMIPELKVILIWRPCAEVAASLVARWIKQRRLHLVIDPISAIRMWLAYNRLVCAYAERFPGELIVLPAARLPEFGDAVRDNIIAWSGGKLLLSAHEDIYHAELLHPAARWLQRLCLVMGCRKQEARLEELSIG